MGKEKKATRKFKQQKLKGEIERRKKVKDFKGKKSAGGPKQPQKKFSKGNARDEGEDGEGSHKAKKATETEKSSQRSAYQCFFSLLDPGTRLTDSFPFSFCA